VGVRKHPHSGAGTREIENANRKRKAGFIMENNDLLCVNSVDAMSSLDPIYANRKRSGHAEHGPGRLLRAWVVAFGHRPATAKDAMGFPSIVAEVEKVTPFGKEVDSLAMGYALRSIKDKFIDGMTLISPSGSKGVRKWRVVPYDVPDLESK